MYVKVKIKTKNMYHGNFINTACINPSKTIYGKKTNLFVEME